MSCERTSGKPWIAILNRKTHLDSSAFIESGFRVSESDEAEHVEWIVLSISSDANSGKDLVDCRIAARSHHQSLFFPARSGKDWATCDFTRLPCNCTLDTDAAEVIGFDVG